MKLIIDDRQIEMTVDEFIDFLEKIDCDCEECDCVCNFDMNQLNNTNDYIIINGISYKLYLNYH